MPSRRGADRTLLQEAHREAALCVARSLSINGCSCTRPEARLPWHAEEKFAFLQLPRRDAAVASDHPVARSDHRLMAVHALRGYPRGVPSQRFFVDELHDRSYFTPGRCEIISHIAVIVEALEVHVHRSMARVCGQSTAAMYTLWERSGRVFASQPVSFTSPCSNCIRLSSFPSLCDGRSCWRDG